ncbi:peptidoglycan DD-metalloendopeptidase family protein [Blastococcus sp. SYSU D00820]
MVAPPVPTPHLGEAAAPDDDPSTSDRSTGARAAAVRAAAVALTAGRAGLRAATAARRARTATPRLAPVDDVADLTAAAEATALAGIDDLVAEPEVIAPAGETPAEEPLAVAEDSADEDSADEDSADEDSADEDSADEDSADEDSADEDSAGLSAEEATAVVADIAAGRRPRGRHAAPSTRRRSRRPALFLAAAITGAVGLGLVTSSDTTAQADAAEPVSESVSVAEELGLTGSADEDALVSINGTEHLGEMAASRAVREAEETAAADAQAEADRLAAEAAAEAARPKAVLPVQGARLTSGFGARWGTLHAGIDLAAPMHTPEYAAMDGVVLEAGPASGFGLAVYIQHDNGDVTVYGHMDEILVQPGQVVRAGDTIALLGNRGQSTGPHLHFEVHVGGLNGEKVDPIPWLRDRGVQI